MRGVARRNPVEVGLVVLAVLVIAGDVLVVSSKDDASSRAAVSPAVATSSVPSPPVRTSVSSPPARTQPARRTRPAAAPTTVTVRLDATARPTFLCVDDGGGHLFSGTLTGKRSFSGRRLLLNIGLASTLVTF